MILNFEQPSLSQKEAVDRIVAEQGIRMCDQTFGNIFCWAKVADTQLAIYKNTFVSKWHGMIAAPQGPQRKELIEGLLADGMERLIGIDAPYKEWLEEQFEGRFSFKERRVGADYIYDRKALETLKGKKLAAKRNHINFFENNCRWEVKLLNDETLEDAARFNDWWCAENDCGAESSLMREGCAVRRGLRHFKELGFFGIILYADGAPCAFSYGEPMGKEGFCVHVEKANADLRGAYPMVNRELVKRLDPEIQWINREDDTGDEGLRKAKLSYRPIELLMKYTAEVNK